MTIAEGRTLSTRENWTVRTVRQVLVDAERDIYIVPEEQWQQLYDVQLNVKQAKGKGAKFKPSYVAYHDMIRALRKHLPGVIPVVLEQERLPMDADGEEYSVLLHVALYNSNTKTYSMIHAIPVMTHGPSAHDAVVNPDARNVSDSIRRAFCRLIAEETGLGYSCWHEEDPYSSAEEEEEAKPSKSKKTRKAEPDFDDDLDDDDFDDDLDDELDDDDEEDDEPQQKKRYRRRRR